MTTRRTARRSALQLLYQSEIWAGSEAAGEVLDGWYRQNRPPDSTWRYVQDTVIGVWDNVDVLDELIERYARGWQLDRMAIVDKNILRLALYEMLHVPDIPAPVSINEAVELAKRYATEETASFVNGILSAVHRDLESGALRAEGNEV